MRCAACDEGGLDTGTTQNRSSLGVLLLMRVGFDIVEVLYRHHTEQIKPMCPACDEGRFRYSRCLGEDTTLNRSR